MMQDFIGFTYNGKHSIQDLKIYRASNSNRYDDNITAALTDKVVDVPGSDGQYYFGTTFKNRTFTINYAFDELEEKDLRTIKEVFCGDGIHDLIFDERPYMAWSAKVTGTASMKHLCFDEGGMRKYKGEGSITFTCYDPYARTPKKLWKYKTNNDGTIYTPKTIVYAEADGKFLNNYNSEIYTNKNEWAEASGLSATTTLGLKAKMIAVQRYGQFTKIGFFENASSKYSERTDWQWISNSVSTLVVATI